MTEHILQCLRRPGLYHFQAVEQLLDMALRRGLTATTDELRRAARELATAGKITDCGDDWHGVTCAQLRALGGASEPEWAQRA